MHSMWWALIGVTNHHAQLVTILLLLQDEEDEEDEPEEEDEEEEEEADGGVKGASPSDDELYKTVQELLKGADLLKVTTNSVSQQVRGQVNLSYNYMYTSVISPNPSHPLTCS